MNAKRHGNYGAPRPQSILAARNGTVASQDSRFLRGDAWTALMDTYPVGLMERTGCCWPVTSDPPHLFCNHPIAPGRYPYCEDHLKRYLTPKDHK